MTDNPIIDSDGSKRWYSEQRLHREDGPAVVCAAGIENWHLDGFRYDDLDKYCEDAGIDGKHKTLLLLKYSKNTCYFL